MFQIVDKLYFQNSILSISKYDESIVAIDSSYYIYRYNNDTKVLQTNKKIIDSEPIYKYIKSLTINSNGYLTLAKKDDNILRLCQYNGDSIKGLTKFDYHKSKIEVSCIYKDKYLASGGADGRVYLYDLAHLKLIAEVLVRPEFISSIVFRDDGKYILITSYDKVVSLYSTDTAKIIKQFKCEDVVEDGVFIDEKVILAQRDGTITIFDLSKMHIISKCQNSLAGWITRVTKIDKNYLLIATRSDTLYIFDIEKNSIKFYISLDSSDMSSIYIKDSLICIGFVSGEIIIIDYMANYQEFSIALKLKEFDKASELINNNIFLRLTKEMDIFDKHWIDILNQAKSLIHNEKIDEALEIAKPFFFDNEKENEFYTYLNNKEKIVEFLKLIESKSYIKALKMAEKNRYLMNLSVYNKLENYWESMFNKAKLILEKDSTQRTAVMNILQPFSIVESKKTLVYQMLNNTHIFSKVEDLVKNKNFHGYFEKLKKYPFLKETLLYRKVISLGNKLYENMVEKFKQNELDSVIAVAETLSKFEPFVHKADEYTNLAKVKKEFEKYVETQDICKSYLLLSKNPFLQQTDLYKVIIKEFNDKIKEAKEYAFCGDTQKVDEILNKYSSNQFTVDKVAQIYKISYLNEFENEYSLEKKAGTDLILVLKNYVQRYGKDDMLQSLLEKLKLEKLLDAIDDSEIAGYKDIGFLNSIFNIAL
jgi:hypothetical protein